MKRDWEIIREILLKVEDSDVSLTLSDFDKNIADIIKYHVILLEEAGLIKASINSFSDGDFIFDLERLTWDGHEFLESIRDDTNWNKIKSSAKEKSLELSFDSIKELAKYLLITILSKQV